MKAITTLFAFALLGLSMSACVPDTQPLIDRRCTDNVDCASSLCVDGVCVLSEDPNFNNITSPSTGSCDPAAEDSIAADCEAQHRLCEGVPGRAACTTCLSGSFSTGESPAICAPWTTCEPGSYSTNTPNPATDRICRTCAEGTFSTTQNASACQDWQACNLGSFVTVEPSSAQNRGCQPCAPGQFSDRPNAMACAPYTECELGEFSAAPSSSSNRLCRPCPANTFNDAVNATTCKPHLTCEPGERELVTPSPSQDRRCEACNPDSFSTSPNAGTCALHRDCAPGEEVLQQPSATLNRTCQACPEDTFSSEENTISCEIWDNCEAGEFVSTAPSLTNQRLCQPCPEAKFSVASNQAECQNHRGPCELGTYEIPGTASKDRECLACPNGQWDDGQDLTTCTNWDTCFPGFQVVTPPSALSNRICEACQVDFFSDTVNADICRPVSPPCSQGTYESTPPRLDRDRTCTPCEVGSFCEGGETAPVICEDGLWDHDANPSTTCIPWSDCQPGTFIANAPNNTTDQDCQACPLGQFADTLNATGCLDWVVSECPLGHEQLAPPNAVADRQCGLCDPGVYCAGGENLPETCFPERVDHDQDASTACAPCIGNWRSRGPDATFCEVWGGRINEQYQSIADNHFCNIRVHDSTLDCDGLDDSHGQVSGRPSGFYLSVVTGGSVSCAIRESDQKPVCWGDDSLGTVSDVPDKAAKQITLDSGHGCIIRQVDDKVECWGDPNHGSGVVGDYPEDIQFQSIDTDYNRFCGVTLGDGLILCRQDPNDIAAPPPPAIGGFQHVQIGAVYSCALTLNNTAVCFSVDNSFEPVAQTPPDVAFVDINLLNATACGLRRSDNKVQCWGQNAEFWGSGSSELSYGNIEGRFYVGLDFEVMCGRTLFAGVQECWTVN